MTMPSRHTIAVALATLAALAVAGAAFTRSFSALSHLAIMHEWPAGEAWILPIALDGMIVVPTVAAVVRRSARWYAWSLLVAGTLLSCAGNGIHAWLTTSSQIAVALAVVPPLVTFFAVHLAIAVARQDSAETVEARAPRQFRLRLWAGKGTPAEEAVATPDETPTEIPDPEPRPVRRLRVASSTPTQPAATQETLLVDIAPATDTELRDEAIILVAEGMSRRAAAAKLGVSKDKVQRWVTEHAATTPRATAAV